MSLGTFTKGYLVGLLWGTACAGLCFAVVSDPPEKLPVICAAETPIAVSITKTSPISMAVRGPAKEMLKRNEGVHTKVYIDSEGNPTIGVGFNLNRPDAEAKIKRLGTSKQALVNGTSALLVSETEMLLDDDLTDVLQDLTTLFADFASLPEKAQLVLIDLRFNCGPAGLRTFVNTLQAIKTAQWQDAAERLSLSQWALQVGDRATRTIALLKGIS